ncbi:TRAP transporter large permease [Chloroflexota bacterium]
MEQSLLIGIVVCFGVAFALLLAGLRIFAVLGLAGIIASVVLLRRTEMLPFIPYTTANNWPLTVMPLFIFMGSIFLNAGISGRLYHGATAFLGRIPGGLLHSNIWSCGIFAAISGSSSGTTATIGTVALPELEKRHYDERVATASIAAGGTLGSLIPPSVVFIAYGVVTNTSIGRLFFGGLIPGLTLALLYSIIIFFWAVWRPGIAPTKETASGKELLLAIKDLIPIFVTIVVVLGGIYMGVFTPTEAAAIGAVLSLILAFMYRKLSWKVVHKSALDAVGITAFILMIYVGTSIFSNAMAALLIPYKLAQWALSLPVTPLVILIFICFFYLMLGCIMESLSAMIMTLPITFPLAINLGYDPVFFGVLVAILVQAGLITPPVGIDLYVVQGIRGKGSLGDVFRGITPFIVAMLVLIALVITFPSLVTWLPSKMIGQ